MRENRPPNGVDSFRGLALSSTLWDMENMSQALRARRGRAQQPPPPPAAGRSAARQRAPQKRSVKSTNQASRHCAAVVGRAAPKNMEEALEAAEGVLEGGAWESAAREGQAAKGKVGRAVLPLPARPRACPAGVPGPLKLYRGREVSPGHRAAPVQGGHTGRLPAVPGAQPRQERLCARAAASEAKLGKAEGRRGRGQARGAQSAREAAAARRGCLPGGQEKGRARHCVSCRAPGEAVVFPAGQALHCATETAPGTPLKVPRGQGLQAEAPAPEKVPGEQRLHAAAPVEDALKEPGAQSLQMALELAPATAPLAVPTGQGVQDVEPSASPKVPAGHCMQLLAFVPPGRARNVPMGQKSTHCEEPGWGARSPAPQRMQDKRPLTL
jgi:hypothetical protein